MFEDCILYEDGSIMVINKPPYFPVQSAKATRPDCVTALKTLLKERDGFEGEPYIGLIHRLDEPVEGIMVFAKTKEAAGILSRELADGGFLKRYTAAVLPKKDGLPLSGVLSDYILTDKRTNTSRIAGAGTKGAKESRLEYETIGEITGKDGERLRLLSVLLYTGRHHQIRVQLSHAGMPIAGDRKYGNVLPSLPLCLASTGLSFLHPDTKKKMSYGIRPEFLEKIS